MGDFSISRNTIILNEKNNEFHWLIAFILSIFVPTRKRRSSENLSSKKGSK